MLCSKGSIKKISFSTRLFIHYKSHNNIKTRRDGGFSQSNYVIGLKYFRL